jgi:hypothetical protein
MPARSVQRKIMWFAVSAGAILCAVGFLLTSFLWLRIALVLVEIGLAISAGRLQYLESQNYTENHEHRSRRNTDWDDELS